MNAHSHMGQWTRQLKSQLTWRRKWDEGASRIKAPLGHVREVSAKVTSVGWFPTTPDAEHAVIKFEPQTVIKIEAVDWLEQHYHLLPEGGQGDASLWPPQVLEVMRKFMEASDAAREEQNLAPVVDRSCPAQRNELVSTLMLPDMPTHDLQRAAKDWVQSSAKAVLRYPKLPPDTERSATIFLEAEGRRKRTEEKIARWVAEGWEDRRPWQAKPRARALPAVYVPERGCWKESAGGGKWNWFPEGVSPARAASEGAPPKRQRTDVVPPKANDSIPNILQRARPRTSTSPPA